MQTILILLGVWILINVLFVVIMISPRRPGLAPAAHRTERLSVRGVDKLLLRHVIVSIAIGAFVSLPPPLIEAVKRFIRMRRE